MPRDIGLDKDGGALRIETGSNPVHCNFPDQFFLILSMLISRSQGVPVGNLKKALILILQFHPIFEGSYKISEMKFSCGAESTQDSILQFFSSLISILPTV